MDYTKLKSPAEATKWLFDHNFIRLPPGSFFNWIENEWFERFRPMLSYKNDVWMPRMDKLTELNNLIQAYRDYEYRKYGEEKSTKQIELDDRVDASSS